MLTINLLSDIHVREPEGDILIFMTGQVWSLSLYWCVVGLVLRGKGCYPLGLLQLCFIIYIDSFYHASTNQKVLHIG